MKLVIAEKPSVANSIADVLGASERCDGYRKGHGYIVSWCIGHLVELAQPQDYDSAYEKWTYENLPIIPDTYQYSVKSDTKKQYGILKKLMEDTDIETVVCATDAGREGELIFRLVYDQAKCNKPIERLWISSMEESAIRNGFDNLKPGKDYEHLYESALARQKADWLVGINGTRLFTVIYNSKVLKVGRVQTPTLAMLVDRETEIMNFKKEPFYTVVIKANNVRASSDKYKDIEEAKKIAEEILHMDARVVSVKKEEKNVNPPKLYDLTTLQRDANRIFGLTAKQTLQYTQNLYEKKLVTYPRTDSQYLSDDMEQTASNVIQSINEAFSDLSISDRTSPDLKRLLNSKKVTDHHAIIPTVEIAKVKDVSISDGEMKVLYLIADRLLCATGNKHIYVTENVEISCKDITFKLSGKTILENGWKDFEEKIKLHFGIKQDADDEEDTLTNSLSEGDIVHIESAEVKEGFTQPPKHYTEDSLLKAMEKAGASDMDDDVERKGLGTPATRADIIEKLVKDSFVKREKKQLIPTEDGMKLITIIPDVLKSPKLTADWENQLVLVSKGEMNVDDFMDAIEKMVKDLVAKYEGVSDKETFASGGESLGVCPNCGAEIKKGKYGAYCADKCGMNLSMAYGIRLSETQIKNLLAGKKILLKGLKSKKGTPYDAYLTPKGVEPYSYTDKSGNERKGIQYQFDMSFPEKK